MDSSITLSLNSSTKSIANYLISKGLLTKHPQKASIEKPGEGNMNLVIRFSYDGQSLILKQSKPFVNKYPSIPAPEERIGTEAKYYQYASTLNSLQGTMPNILLYDAENHLLVMEDLGASKDFLHLYQKDHSLKEEDVKLLLQYLSTLHQQKWSVADIQQYPDNLKLRQLNYEHIFDLPFRENNGFPLEGIQEGLGELAKKYSSDSRLVSVIKQMGQIYLSQGQVLIHGDYYPGSWVKTDGGIKIIDPEFSFMGTAEFELGVFIAHLRMSGMLPKKIVTWLERYYTGDYDLAKAEQFASIEIMRRIIGIAQLPLEMSIEEKAQIMESAKVTLLATVS